MISWFGVGAVSCYEFLLIPTPLAFRRWIIGPKTISKVNVLVFAPFLK